MNPHLDRVVTPRKRNDPFNASREDMSEEAVLSIDAPKTKRVPFMQPSRFISRIQKRSGKEGIYLVAGASTSGT
jgi:hypothetical protein